MLSSGYLLSHLDIKCARAFTHSCITLFPTGMHFCTSFHRVEYLRLCYNSLTCPSVIIVYLQMGPRPTGMPPRNSVSNSQRVSGRGSSGRALGGRSGGRGSGGRGGSASGRGGRGRGRSAGRGNNNSYVKQAQDVDLDQSLDECEQAFSRGR